MYANGQTTRTHVQKSVHINTVPVSSVCVCEGEQAEEELRGRDAAVKQ